LAHIQSSIAFQMGAGLFKHLLRLPLVYFEKRHVGDLVSRFGSTEPIRHLFAEGLISVGIDGVMAVLTLTMIFIYAPSLGAIVLAALFVYVLLRIVFFHKLRRSSLDLMVARAREGTTFIETVRAIESIKLFGREAERCAVWMNHHAELTSFSTTRRWKSAARNQATFLVGRRRSRLPSTRKEKMSLPKFWRQRRRRRQRLPRVDQEVALQAIVRSASTRSNAYREAGL
jgi:ABC-type bacteriocin/lantibiotic exporter with double-glycine peptidase domain